MQQTLILSRPFDGLRKSAASLKARAQGIWRTHPRETLGFGLLGAIAAVAIAGSAHSIPELPGPQAAPPAPPPLLVQQIAPDQALKVNSAIPIAVGPNPAAAP